MANISLLTTVDNPFDPFTQWEQWLAYDAQKKHFTCELIARISGINLNDTEEEKDLKLFNATELILDFSPFHLRVYQKSVDGGEGPK